MQRIYVFEAEINKNDGTVDHLSSDDIHFLRNEIMRYRGYLNTFKAMKDYHLADSF